MNLNIWDRLSLNLKKQAIVFFTIVLVLIALMNIYHVVIINQNSNDECLWIRQKISSDSVRIVFKKVKENGVSYDAGIRNDDNLLAINGIKINRLDSAQRILDKVDKGKYAEYLVKRGERTFTTYVYVKKIFQLSHLAFSLFGFFWVLIGFIVVYAKPDGYIQKLFYKIGAYFVLTYTWVYLWNSNVPKSIIITSIVDYLWVFSGIYTCFYLLQFFWNFPAKIKLFDKKWIRLTLKYLPLVIFILIVINKIFFLEGKYSGREIFNKSFTVITILLNITAVTNLISLATTYFKIKSKSDRKPILIILVSFILAVLSFIYAINFETITGTLFFNQPYLFTPIILIIALPISFGYSILKYQLMDVSAVLRNTIVYGSATLSLAILYLLLVYGIGQSLGSIVGSNYQNFVTIITFVLFALIFQSTKDKFQELLTRKFYPEQFAYQEMLLKFSKEISGYSYFNLDKILDSISDTFIKSFKLKKFGIILKNENSNACCIERKIGLKYLVDCNLSNSDIITEKILVTQSMSVKTVIEDSSFDYYFPTISIELRKEEIFTVVPLIVNARVIGLLLFGLKFSGSKFSEKDIDLLEAITSQAAITIENARLYKNQAEKLKMERDLEHARKIQQNLLPKQIPQFENVELFGTMIPAMQVGGDYYDIIPINDKKFFVIVGDVSGKGLSASLYMTKLQTILQFYCCEEKNPKDILIEINKRIYHSLERNYFITLSLAMFDLENKVVKFCRAGHLPILAFQNGTVFNCQSKGIALGLDKGLVFEKSLTEEELKLSSNQLFVFYSDGITETMNELNEFYGNENLEKVIKENKFKSTEEIFNSIWNSLNEFKGRAEQHDDITAVLIKVK